ncbi:MAG: twin-arginine translocation signal domain-containing protein, partial [Sphingomonas sp.]|nr:twin-arginine translocation signal domain-containing protein [Sphingomonas sp.]
MILPRRHFLRFAAVGAGAILVSPRMAFASVPGDRRFIFIIQRGAADGLNTVV